MLTTYKELIESNPISIATTDGEVPNIAVASAVGVISDNEILICQSEMHKTVENIVKNNRICFTCFDKEWQGIRGYGTAKYFAGDNEYSQKSREFLADKNSPVKGAILITVHHLEEQS
jgi:flavin reductase (DIM6/NTAB) family NADH-FMN oxidoreductase RutF